MADPVFIPGDLNVAGSLRLNGTVTPAIAKANVLALATAQLFPVPLTDFRVWDAMASLLPSAGANDDLGLVGGTFGTATPSLRTQDLKTAGASSNYARVLIQLPWEYVAGQAVKIRLKAGMITTVAGTSAFLDCEAFKLQGDPDDAIGSDLVSTSQTTINSLTFADIDFTVTPSSLSPGDILDVRIRTIVTDAASGTAVIAGITSARLVCDVR